MASRIFLTAEWRYLLMMNYEIDPAILQPYVPRGTELDFFEGRTFVSLVGFRFINTRVLGCRVPFHSDFDEVNLRFYVKRRTVEGIKRGVVFIREIVPKRMIAFVARRVYNERYIKMPMRNIIALPTDTQRGTIRYDWYAERRWHGMMAGISSDPQAAKAGSEEEFITEHYWGYTMQRDGSTLEYEVTHPKWLVWSANEAKTDIDLEAIYGREFVSTLGKTPTSSFVADGSEIAVYKGTRVL